MQNDVQTTQLTHNPQTTHCSVQQHSPDNHLSAYSRFIGSCVTTEAVAHRPEHTRNLLYPGHSLQLLSD